MSSIDERVVEMKFNNSQFESGVKTTQKSLDDLKKGLNLDESAKSLNGLQAAGDRFSLAGIANGIEGIGSKFTALGVMGVTALATITSQAVSAGERLVSSLTIDPIKAGLDEYTTNLNSVQTILSNTQASGAKLSDVNSALNELNTYSDKTIYNFSEMARNIGTFTAAGVALKPAVASIKGIANLAALSGSNSEQASSAMYQLSQAISAGRVGLQDWNSVVNAGMGGTVFQRALATTAVAMGKLPASAVKLSGAMKNVKVNGEAFRDSISAKGGKPSWLSSDVLTKTLAQFTGDMTAAQLKTQGFTDAQIKGIQAQAKMAQQAATVVKTLPALIGTMQESVGSGWTQSWQTVIGDFEEAKKLWTGVNNVLGGMIQNSANARNKMLGDWKALGGRTAAIDAIKNSFNALMGIFRPIQEAFREIFPATTGKQLADITKAIDEFTKKLKPGRIVTQEINDTFRGLFAVLDIGRMIIVGVVKMFFSLFKSTGDAGGSILDITSTIGVFLVKLRDAIKNGDGLKTFFEGLGAVLSVPISLISALVGYIARLATGFQDADGSGFAGTIEGVTKKINPLNAMANLLIAVWQRMGAAFKRVWDFFQPMASAMGDILNNLGSAIADSVKTGDFNHVLDIINTGLLGGIVLMVKKFLKGGFNFNLNLGGSGKDGLFGKISEAFEGVTGSLQAMQQNLKANVLLKIAGALGILTVSVVALSMIDSAGLTRALTAITVMFTQLGLAMAGFDKISTGGMLKLPLLTTSMILLGIAINILASAVAKLAKLDWGSLAKGLIGVTVLLAAVAGALQLMPDGKRLISAGAGMILVATAINILTKAVSVLGSMKPEVLTQGLLGIAGALLIVEEAMNLMPGPSMVLTGAGLLIVSAAMVVLSKALTTMGSMTWEQIGTGLTVLAGSLVLLAAAMYAMEFGLPGAAALVVAAGALMLLAPAMKSLGDLSWAEIGAGLTVLAGALVIMAVGLTAMIAAGPGAAALVVASAALAILAPVLGELGSLGWATIGAGLGALAASLVILAVGLTAMIVALPGAAALVVAAGALAVFAPILLVLGTMSWATIGTGLAVLAISFTVLGVAGALLTPVIPTLLGLAGAIALLGIGVALAGVGVLAFATGLTALGVAGAAGAAGLTATFSAILGLIPMALTQLGLGIVALAGVVTKGAPAIVGALVAVLMSLIGAIGKVAPAIISTLIKMVVSFATTISNAMPKLVAAGYKIIVAILTGVANNIGKIVDKATDIVVNFINGISRGLPRIIDAGVRMIINFVNGLATAIRQHTAEMNAAGVNLAKAIIDGMTSGLRIGFDALVSAATNIASGVLNTVKMILGIHSPSKEFEKVGIYINQGLVQGLLGTHDQVTSAISTLQDDLKSLVDSSAQDISTYQQKISDLKGKISKDGDAISAQRDKLNKAKADRRSGETVDRDTVKLMQLTAARERDTASVKKAQKEVSSARSANAKAAARVKLDSAKATLASNGQAIKDAKAKLAKDKADRAHGTTVAAAQKKLNDLVKSRSADNAALAAASKSLSAAQVENKKATAATNDLNVKLAAQTAQLEDLATKNDALTQSISDQQKVLDDAKKTRDDYNKSITDQYDALQTIGSDTNIADYETSLQKQIDDTKAFTNQLEKLRSEGLNDTLYKKFLAEGTDAMPFLEQLLDQGKSGVNYLNQLTDTLQSSSASLGSIASTQLYQAGVDAAQGLLDGLTAQQKAIEAQMDSIAQAMLKSLKSALGIKSPSREFKAIGGYSGEGLITGLNQTSDAVAKAAVGVGNTALDALKETMSGITDAVSSEVDMNPTIRPVLDLTAIQQGAAGINGLLNPDGLSANGNYANATAAANGIQANQDAMAAVKQGVASSGGTTFIQNNNSPKALSPAEIYRQTKNQLSVAKGANA